MNLSSSVKKTLGILVVMILAAGGLQIWWSLSAMRTLQEEKNFGPFTVPPARYFVLGDFRSNSIDSRHFGPIEHKSIKGKVTQLIFSRTPNYAIRWDRLPRKL